MGKRVFKLFLETMLRAAVIILGVGVVVMLALFVKTVVKNNKEKKTTTEASKGQITTEAAPSEEDSSTEAVSTEAATVSDSKTAGILVINATGISGVAGGWQQKLSAAGYTNVEVGNYKQGVLSQTKVCVSGNFDGTDLSPMFTTPEMSTTDTLSATDFDVQLSNFDIVILVGTNDANK